MNYSEPSHRYVFNLTAEQLFSDRAVPTISKAIVQITLKNDNVNKPMFLALQSIFYIAETAPVKTEFGTVYAMDLDGDGIEYSISHTHFNIHPSTGVLRLEESLLGLSWVNPLKINVTATDDGSSCSWAHPCERKWNLTTISINVIQENRYAPYFSGNLCGGDIAFRENNAVDAMIESLTVWDKDQAENETIDVSFPSEELQATGKCTIECFLSRKTFDFLCSEWCKKCGLLRFLP